MSRNFGVSFFESIVLWEIVKVVPAHDDCSVHFG